MTPNYWYGLSEQLVKRLGPAKVAQVGDVWRDCGRVKVGWFPQTMPFGDELYVHRPSVYDTKHDCCGNRWTEASRNNGMMFNIDQHKTEYKIVGKLKTRIKYVVNKITINRKRPPTEVADGGICGGWKKTTRGLLGDRTSMEWGRLYGNKKRSGSGTLDFDVIEAGGHVGDIIALERRINNMRYKMARFGGDGGAVEAAECGSYDDAVEVYRIFLWEQALEAAEAAGCQHGDDGDLVLQGRLLHYVMGDPTHVWSMDMARFKTRCKVLNNINM